MSSSLGLGFLKFTVRDLAAMEAFYREALGMTVQKRLDFPDLVEVILSGKGGADLALVWYKDGREISLGNASGPIGVYLKDVDEAYARALAAGATSRMAPVSADDIRVAFVADPEGHEIEFLRLD